MTAWEDLLQKTINTSEFLSEINTKGFWKCDDSVIKYATSKDLPEKESVIEILESQKRVLEKIKEILT